MTVVERLRRMLAEATPGPWEPSTDEPGDVVIWGPREDWLANVRNWARQHEPPLNPEDCARQFVELRDAADAALVSALRNHAAALLDIVEAATELDKSFDEKLLVYHQIASVIARKQMRTALSRLVALDEGKERE